MIGMVLTSHKHRAGSLTQGVPDSRVICIDGGGESNDMDGDSEVEFYIMNANSWQFYTIVCGLTPGVYAS